MDDIIISGSVFDHTLLTPTVSSKSFTQWVKEASEYNFSSLCVNPFFVKKAAQLTSASGTKICTVVGFPHGANILVTKISETLHSVWQGASEIDYVVNLAHIADRNWEALELEASKMRAAAPNNITVKAIIETGIHADNEIFETTKAVTNGGVDFVKTCSGFNGGKATPQAVELMLKAGALQVKASGGIGDLKTVKEMLNAGATRIGSSKSVDIIKEQHGGKPAVVKNSNY